MKRTYQLGFIFVIVSGIGLGISASAEESLVPTWIKNTALWYGEGQVSDAEFVSALQFLINQDVIKVPITQVDAVTTDLSDNERGMSIAVHFEGEMFEQGETIYTYSQFEQVSSKIKTGDSAVQFLDAGNFPTFFLIGVPSLDKHKIYELIDEFVNPQRPPAQYDITVDLLTADGTIIQSWEYRNCGLFEYSTYLETSKEVYMFSGVDESEYREITSWDCSGYRLTFP